ncbi:MAG: phosphatidate cytidylyltransferase [Bacillota bacterium]|nr:phosphatidate cytidylyltransferase [Bacillota bacterium]
MLSARIVGALLLGPVVLFGLYKGGYALSALALVVSRIAIGELDLMLRRKGLHIVTPVAYGGMVAIVAAAHVGRLDLLLAAVVLSVPASMLAPVFSGGRVGQSDVAATIYCIVYVPLTFAHIVLLRDLGVWPAATAVAATWACDVAAYFVGKSFGRHKMAPSVSPNKSWEGFWAGLAGSAAAVWALSRFTGLGPGLSVVAGIILSLAAQAGDLAESCIKRFCSVKDAGTLIPGHGGILDRFDSLMFVAPVAYYLFLALR